MAVKALMLRLSLSGSIHRQYAHDAHWRRFPSVTPPNRREPHGITQHQADIGRQLTCARRQCQMASASNPPQKSAARRHIGADSCGIEIKALPSSIAVSTR